MIKIMMMMMTRLAVIEKLIGVRMPMITLTLIVPTMAMMVPTTMTFGSQQVDAEDSHETNDDIDGMAGDEIQ